MLSDPVDETMTRTISSRWTLLNRLMGIALGTLPIPMAISLIRDVVNGRGVTLERTVTTVLLTAIGALIVLFHLNLKKVELAADGIVVKPLMGKYKVNFCNILKVSAWHPLGLKLLFAYIPHVVVTFREPVLGHKRVVFLARIVRSVGFWHPHPDVLLLRKMADEAHADPSLTGEPTHD